MLGLVGGRVMRLNSDGPSVATLIMVQYKSAGAGAGATEERVFVSNADAAWKVTTEPYVLSNSAWATAIDWSKNDPQWSTPQFVPNASTWSPLTVDPAPYIPARALGMPLSVRIGGSVHPTAVRQLHDESYLYTFPKNLVGTLTVAPLPTAATGSRVELQLGEWLTPVNAPYAPTPGVPPPPPSSLIFPHISG